MTAILTAERGDRGESGGQPGATPAPKHEADGEALKAPSRRLRAAGNILGTLPYFLFVGIFLVIPVVVTVAKAFIGPEGEFTLTNFQTLGEAQYLNAFSNSLNLSLITSVIGAVIGLMLGWALVNLQGPAWLDRTVTSLAAVASQMGGPPLAYAFIAFIGAQGVLTVWLRDLFGFELNEVIPISSFWGIVVAYLYFQIPLMTILSIPALRGIRREWLEGGMSLGAGRARILFSVTLPILAPSLVGGFLLLFANAFSGYAAAYAMAGSGSNLVPILIGFFLSGNVLVNQGLASALITGMVAIMLIAMGLRGLLLRRATRWSAGS